MRWIVFSLLVLNVAYFGWEYSRSAVPAVSSAQEYPLPPVQGDRLVLLTERLPAATSSAPPPAPVIIQEPGAVHRELDKVEIKKEALCVSVGPYQQEANGRMLVKNLLTEGIASELEELELSRDTQYWVLLAPASTRREAMQTLKNLQAKKIDSYLVSTGELRNAISLGLFNKECSARGVLASVKEAGFPAELRQKESVESEFWVRIPPGQPVENLEKTLETLVVQGSGIKISKAACEMFAQTK